MEPVCVDSGSRYHGGNRDNDRSEEHTSELQSRSDLVCRLLLEKKKIPTPRPGTLALTAWVRLRAQTAPASASSTMLHSLTVSGLQFCPPHPSPAVTSSVSRESTVHSACNLLADARDCGPVVGRKRAHLVLVLSYRVVRYTLPR